MNVGSISGGAAQASSATSGNGQSNVSALKKSLNVEKATGDGIMKMIDSSKQVARGSARDGVGATINVNA